MTIPPPPDAAAPGGAPAAEESAAAVLRNRPFLLLWLAQLVTQVGGNMVLYGLVVIVSETTQSTTAASALILSFLVPAVLFSAVAGVYVDRMDRRHVLIATNVLRAVAFVAMWLVGDHLLAILLLTITVSTLTTFFAPAEAAMIPFLVPRRQLIAANSVFTLTLNGAFALGFALFGPLILTIAGAPALILLVAVLYLVAAAFTWSLPPAPSARLADRATAGGAVADAERAVEGTILQLREGLAFIRSHRNIIWSLTYLGIAASLVGVLGVLGPTFAQRTLGLDEKDFVVVVLPLGAGIVMGILLLNSYGHLLARRRVIEGGLIGLGGLLAALSVAGPISQFLRAAQQQAPITADLSAVTSLLAVVVAIAFLAGISYAFVAIPSQTQLHEDIPEDVRGRVFGVLNMQVSIASFLPIIIVGPIADVAGTTTVIFLVALVILLAGVASVVRRGPLGAAESSSRAAGTMSGMGFEPIAIVQHADPAPIDPTAPDDDGIAPWIRAAGWTVDPDPEPAAEAEPGADPASLIGADPFGVAPDDPEALARAETATLELPWQTDDDRADRDRAGSLEGPAPRPPDERA